MPIERGSYAFGPETGTLTVRTKKGGAAAKAGHDLEIEVKRWSATLDLTDTPAASLTADSTSFEVISATGGAAPFGAQEKAAVPKTVNDEVLKGTPIEFHASKVDMDRGGHSVDIEGELDLMGQKHPVKFTLNAGFDGRLAGTATITQSEWGITPYSALFGTLKVADDVEVEIRTDTRRAAR
jgi:polyisoprenoid-binding protein YceI